MFSYGAIKPILTVSDSTITNDACMLAGLGCIIQLCRIPEIGTKMVQQGAVPVVEKALLRTIGHANGAIREKAVYALGFLSKIPDVKTRVCTTRILKGLRNEFVSGTMTSKTTVLQILMNVHRKYEGEREYLLAIRDVLLDLLRTGPWTARNLCIRAMTVLYTEEEDKMHFIAQGVVERIAELVATKGQDLQEAPIVALLYLCSHPDIPQILLQKGVAKLAAGMLSSEDEVIKELSVILLKALLLYNSYEVERVVPPEKDYLLKRDLYNPQLFGAEYGGLIQEYLQTIVENRRDQNYLINMFTEEDVKLLKLTYAELESYQNTFMEIDAECSGTLDIDELKLLMVLMGEKMDKDEIVELLEEYDTDHSGNLDFKEFVIMMKGWATRFGTGMRKTYNISTKRGPIGKSRREWSLWWNKDKLEAAKVAEAKEKRLKKSDQSRDLEVQFRGHEQMALKRENEMRMREIGFSRSRNYAGKLPPISQQGSGSSVG
eukprot:gene32231-39799_t